MQHINKLYKDAICINTKGNNGKKRILKWSKKRNINLKFIPATYTNMRHKQTRIIENASNKYLNSILLCNDDALYVAGTQLNPPPNDWNILYFGGRVITLTDHSNEHWKKGIFRDANFIIIRRNSYKTILNALHKDKFMTFDNILMKLSQNNKLNTYCSNPQIVSSFNAESQGKTNIFLMDNTPDSIETINYNNNNENDINNNTLITLVTVPNKFNQFGKAGYHDSVFDALEYCFIKDQYKHKQWIIVIPPNISESLSQNINEFSENFNNIYIVKCDESFDNRGAYWNWTLNLLSNPNNNNENLPKLDKESLIAHYECGYYYARDYLQKTIEILVSNPKKSLIGTTKTLIFDISRNSDEMRYLIPTDINNHNIILDPAFIIYKLNMVLDRKFLERPGNPMLSFIQDRFEECGHFNQDLIETCGFRIVGKTDFENLESPAPNIKTFFHSEVDFNILECIFKTY